jgi:hypothetical protein
LNVSDVVTCRPLASQARRCLLFAALAWIVACPRFCVAQIARESALKAVGDSLGLSHLNAVFNILPNRDLTTGLTLGDLRASAPSVEVIGASAFGMAASMARRPDNVQIGYIFRSNDASSFGGIYTDSSVVDRIDILWEGPEIRTFESLAQTALAALRSVPTPPNCLDHLRRADPPNVTSRRFESAWFANGWISSLFVSAISSPTRTNYVLQYRAFRLQEPFKRSYTPVSQGWECFPDLNVLLSPFRSLHR